MNSKLLTTLLVVGVLTWAGLNNLGDLKAQKNLQVDPANALSTSEEESNSLKQEEISELGLYNSKTNRKLTGGAILINQHGNGRLNGKFQFSFPTIVIVVTQEYFIFRGCRDYRVPIYRKSKGIEFGPCQSEECDYDPAYRIAQRFYGVVKFKRHDNGFSCFNDDDEETFRVYEKKDQKKGKKVHGQFYQGQYQAEHPSYNVEIDDDQFYFEGHHDKPIRFDYKDDDSINFNKHFEKKKDLPVYDRDHNVADLLISVSKVKRRDDKKGYDFQDKKGRKLVNCYPKKW